jgi:hypothetical protein
VPLGAGKLKERRRLILQSTGAGIDVVGKREGGLRGLKAVVS